ncbi:hypothetical protein PsYK624_003790 [Phanerochaete sordida]|uniref:DUF6533 domain-containing protein n=1 Tax=Phanerochaete sordida TaxID=48140 RepID=A0A9P3FWD4_9APHY|nr:hypothetical protein PsYK624_003790 [Phanerochaete sordida]
MAFTLALGNVYAAVLTIAVYEWVMNIDKEISLGWRKDRKLSTAMLFAIRLATIIFLGFAWINGSWLV